MFKPAALALIKKKRANFEQIAEFCHSPNAFLEYLDSAGIARAVLSNNVAPEVIGFSHGGQQRVAEYARTNPSRLIACGGLHPRHSPSIMADVGQVLRPAARMLE